MTAETNSPRLCGSLDQILDIELGESFRYHESFDITSILKKRMKVERIPNFVPELLAIVVVVVVVVVVCCW